ncbi:MAG: hypothetical protein Q9157_007689 [Trypethelium eluteriae]
MSEDKVKCFEYLHDNVPSWISSLSHLEKTIDERPKEYTGARTPALPSRRRTGSTETLRVEQARPEPNPSTAARSPSPNNQTPQTPQTGPSSQATAQHLEPQQYFQPRKRKPASVLSIGGRSGPTKYRSRSLLIVYYDGDVQKTFEHLVRCIGTGRNLIRKGKLAARLEALAEMAPDDSDDDDDEDCGDDDYDFKGMHKIQFTPRSMRSPRRIPSGTLGPRIGTTTAPVIYDRLDKALERTQMMCEKAAHQYLRDGDCRLEIREAKKSLEEVIKLVEPEYVRLCEKENVEPEPMIEEVPKNSEEKTDAAKVVSMDEIEVDDEPDDDMEIKLSFPRANRRMQLEVTEGIRA